jgi:glutathione synthase/RimK-type ligase-like ATP-grasp enzyme
VTASVPGPRYVCIANPDSKRWQDYAPALHAFWAERGIRPDVEVVPWRVVVPPRGNLDALPAFDRPAVVRLESPGRDWEATRMLLAAGARSFPAEASTDWLALPYQKGRLVRPGLLYEGFRRVLHGLRAAFDARPHLTPTACPLAIAEMFDKNATSARLSAAGVPCPPALPAPDTSAELLDLLRGQFPTAYVKLNTGSSASAIAVVRAGDAPPSAVSSIVRLGDGFFSTRRLRRHTGDDLHAVLGFLLREGACVQRGIRMAQIDGQNFDVRVVVIGGSPAFTVFRLSGLPMTNLHLGGRRGDPGRCRAAVPTRAWLDGLDSAVEAARCYRSAGVGVDLLFESGYLRHYVLEVNAFGDFFPGLVDTQGRSIPRVEIEATARACGLIET